MLCQMCHFPNTNATELPRKLPNKRRSGLYYNNAQPKLYEPFCF